MDKKLKVVLAVAVVIAIGGAYAFPSVRVQVQKELGAQPQQVTDGDCLFSQGTRICTYTQKMSNASTTCSFKSPAASSTVEAFATFTNTYGGSFDVAWGKSTSAYATTTSLGYKAAAIASGDLGTFVASSSDQLLALSTTMEDPASIIAPSTYVNFKVGSSSPTLAGKCTATFIY